VSSFWVWAVLAFVKFPTHPIEVVPLLILFWSLPLSAGVLLPTLTHPTGAGAPNPSLFGVGQKGDNFSPLGVGKKGVKNRRIGYFTGRLAVAKMLVAVVRPGYKPQRR